MSIHSTRRVVIGALTAILALFWVTPAAYAEEYSYWSLWETSNDQWAPAQTGAGGISLTDGTVIGARYVRTAEALSTADAPNQPAAFAELCPEQAPAPDGSINVAVVIDFGDTEIAPTGSTPPAGDVSCEVLPAGSNGSTALAAAATVTASSDGFITDIGDYPSSAQDGAATSSADGASGEQSSTNWAVPIAIAVAASVTVIAATAQMRKRRNESAQSADPTHSDATGKRN